MSLNHHLFPTCTINIILWVRFLSISFAHNKQFGFVINAIFLFLNVFLSLYFPIIIFASERWFSFCSKNRLSYGFAKGFGCFNRGNKATANNQFYRMHRFANPRQEYAMH